MSYRDPKMGQVSAVFRDYGPEAWYDNEPDLRRDAEFVVLDPESWENRCAFLRSLDATAGAGRWAVEEVLLRGMHGASPEAIRAVMADPAALCDVHYKAWTTEDGLWAEAVRRFRFQPRRSTPARIRPAAIRPAAASNDEILEYDITLGGHGSRSEIQGIIQLRRARGDDQPHSWWLTLRCPHVSEQCGGRSGNATAEYRDQIVILECADRLGNISRLEVLLQINHQGELISDRYFLKDVDPTRKEFDFTLRLEPGGPTGGAKWPAAGTEDTGFRRHRRGRGCRRAKRAATGSVATYPWPFAKVTCQGVPN